MEFGVWSSRVLESDAWGPRGLEFDIYDSQSLEFNALNPQIRDLKLVAAKTEGEGFGDMFGENGRGDIKVGNGLGDFDGFKIAASGKVEVG